MKKVTKKVVLKNCSLKGTFGNQNGSSAASQQNLYLEPLFLRVLGAWWKHAALGTKKTDICRLYQSVLTYLFWEISKCVCIFLTWFPAPVQTKEVILGFKEHKPNWDSALGDGQSQVRILRWHLDWPIKL